ncbi:NAD-dependent epimerase/dehydratase family protein [Orenia marismortui]|uniref:NAD-dependent epimerase/dehydratase family protein n=1 Tax=Orenia marismortui TaxID=46469 RepID=UPI00035CBB6D|nr:NAD-dependent epimerase/dehydratase family protein [Orenia marismortui]
MKKVLVMGGTEFVSKSLAKYLISKAYEVDIFTRGKKKLDYSGVKNHLTGNRHSIKDLKDKLSDRKYNYIFDISAYTREDVESLIKIINKEELKRYVFCSSGAVYIPKPNQELISENYPRGTNPHWGEYGLAKAKAEDHLFKLYKEEKFPITIFRPTYIYGEENNLYREVYFFDRVLKGQPIPIPDIKKKVQFIYIWDLVKSFEKGALSKASLGKAYNLTHPEKITWEGLINKIMEVTRKDVNLIKVDKEFRKQFNLVSKDFFPFRNINFILSTERLKEDEIYLPATSLEEGLRRSYLWYLKEDPNQFVHSMTKIDFILDKLE